jgi:hypothetical protein
MIVLSVNKYLILKRVIILRQTLKKKKKEILILNVERLILKLLCQCTVAMQDGF